MTDSWGVTDGYHDVAGGWHETNADTRRALHDAMGARGDHPPEAARPVWFVRCGDGNLLRSACRLRLEDGSDGGVVHSLPPALPAGYHDLEPLDAGPTTRVIASPGRCHLPSQLRGWLWAAQLYAARSAQSWGIGDLGDLAALVRGAAADGAWGVVVNPLHAPLPIDDQQPSPYYPSSRRWLHPLLVRIEDVPGAALDAEVGALGWQAKQLCASRTIDRDAVWHLKKSALEHIWSNTHNRATHPTFAAWRRQQGDALESYARFCALAEHHRSGWHDWPADHRHPGSPAVTSFATEHQDRVDFHAWIQWLLDRQLAEITDVNVVYDLAIGVDPGGADAWVHQDLLALDVRVGAPPDEFAADGQDWGLPPFVPWKLRAAAYEPLIDVLRSSLRSGGLRVDHVMGLFRLFWIPQGGTPHDGAYVRYPDHELLELLCIESQRAGAVVVGEDLGTVEDEVRATLHAAGVLSYRVAWFEDRPPSEYPTQALATMTTHDLPTVAGVWSGRDAEEVRALGRDHDAEAVDGLRSRLDALGASAGDGAVAVATTVHRQLAAAPSMLVAATLDDVIGVEERPNLPGTTDERANWSLALPLPIDDVLASPGARAAVDAFKSAGR